MKSDHSIKNTVEFPGIWESVHNADFNYGEFATIKSQAGLNAHPFSANGVAPSRLTQTLRPPRREAKRVRAKSGGPGDWGGV